MGLVISSLEVRYINFVNNKNNCSHGNNPLDITIGEINRIIAYAEKIDVSFYQVKVQNNADDRIC